jgi:hypothetical protein
MKRQANWAEESDVVYWRRVYAYLQRAGVTSGIKRQMRRRERREGKQEARRDV